jgi:hypothetical protein
VEVFMDRRHFVTAGSLALLFGLSGLSSVAQADPPSWAPAHGRRRRDGTESEYTGKKNKNRGGDDDLDSTLSRRDRPLARTEREERLLRRERELDRMERERRLIDREQALRDRERRRTLQLGDLPRLFRD